MTGTPDAVREEKLARLLDDLLALTRRGQRPDLDAVAREHPEFAAELRQLWATAQFADQFAPAAADRPSHAVHDALTLDRTAALKVILHGEQASVEALARFQTEAQAAARLDNHPGIVPVYEVGACEGLAYFSMKYVEGTT